MKAVFIRAAIVAVVLGSVLTLINQPGWVAGKEPLQVLQLVLVFLLPFGVVAVAQIVGARQAQRDSAGQVASSKSEGFASTISSHGIPARAAAISVLFGGFNAVAVVVSTLVNGADLATIDIVPLGQAFVLPLVFGLVSQAIAYRRARSAIAGA